MNGLSAQILVMYDRERTGVDRAAELEPFADLPDGDQQGAWSMWKAQSLWSELDALDALTLEQRARAFTILRAAGLGSRVLVMSTTRTADAFAKLLEDLDD